MNFLICRSTPSYNTYLAFQSALVKKVTYLSQSWFFSRFKKAECKFNFLMNPRDVISWIVGFLHEFYIFFTKLVATLLLRVYQATGQ